jgi:thiol-disulfide isomerase/thioredoxin
VQLDVRDGALRAPGENCAGSYPFLYLHASAPYRIQDGDGATVVQGRLPQGEAVAAFKEDLGVPRVPTVCRMRLSVRAPARGDYRLVVDGSEPLRFSGSERTVVLSVPSASGGGDVGDGVGEPARATPDSARGGAAALPDGVPAGVEYRRTDPKAPPAPEFTLSLVDGRRVAVERVWRERPVVLVFFSSWCGPCARDQPAVDALARRYDDAIAFLGVAGEDESQAVGRYLSEHEVPYAVGIDASLDIWRRYAVREPPAVVVIGRGGRLLRGWTGPIDAERLERELERLVVAG